MTVDEFIDKLAKPQYVLRMAKPFEYKDITALNKPMIESARKRAEEARKKIDELIIEYVNSNGIVSLEEQRASLER